MRLAGIRVVLLGLLVRVISQGFDWSLFWRRIFLVACASTPNELLQCRVVEGAYISRLYSQSWFGLGFKGRLMEKYSLK